MNTLHLVLAVLASQSSSADWPQFHGPNRDSLCAETGLLKQWPEGGPKLLWQIKTLGRGWSNLAFSGGRIFTMGDRVSEGKTKSQFVVALDEASQKELWATQIGPPYRDGPRCTPTVDGGLLFVIGTEGDLVCLETANGTIRWKKNFAQDFGGKMMTHLKYCESPLVDGEKLVCTPGGPEATLVALNKNTGKLIWKSEVPNIGDKGKDGAGYASMVVAEADGIRQYVQIIGRGVVGVDANSGKFLWGYNRIASITANIPSAVVRGNHVFVANGYQTGSVLLKLTRKGDGVDVQEVYFLNPRQFQNHHGGFVLVGDYIYGGHGQNSGAPTCLELLTGKIVWQPKALGKGSASVLYADGDLYVRYQDAQMLLVEASPKGFRIKGKFATPTADISNCTHPVIHEGKLYLRTHELLMCYDVRQQ